MKLYFTIDITSPSPGWVDALRKASDRVSAALDEV